MGATTIAQDQQHTIGTIIKNAVELLTERVVGMHSTVCPLLRFYLSPFIVCFGNTYVHKFIVYLDLGLGAFLLLACIFTCK